MIKCSGKSVLKGIAIVPAEGKVYAPADGEISTVFPTGHALGLTTEDGIELLIHIGLDTVQLNGQHFTIKTEAGKKVKKGDLLVEADLEKIKEAGYDVITPMIVCNTTDFASVEGKTGIAVKPGDDCLEIKK